MKKPPVSTVEVAAAVNDQEVLRTCLLRSPDIASGRTPFRSYEGFKSAGAAYNAALDSATADYVILVHQDVYMPPGAVTRLVEQLDELSETDPDWAVAGVVGMDAAGRVQGHAWSSGIGGLAGVPLSGAVQVETLDELLLVVRRESGLRFDDQLPGFHLYGADIVQIAKAAGRTSYVAPLLVIHHSRPVVMLPADYRRCYRYVANKWRPKLPLPNLVCPLSANPAVLWWSDLRIRRFNRFRTARVEPKGDPVEIFETLVATGQA